jgi:hypothetical protein
MNEMAMGETATAQAKTAAANRAPTLTSGSPSWGVDTRGDHFLQEARAREVSLGGALIVGLDAELRSGDVIGILYAGNKARYRVVWVRHSGTGDKVQAAVHRLAPDDCPWKDLLTAERAESEAKLDPSDPDSPC